MPERIGLAAVFDMKDFNKAVKSYGNSLQKMNTLTTGITGKMGKAFTGVAKFVGKTMVAGIALGATAIAGLGVGMAKLAIDAAPLQGIKAAFEGITEASGVAADEMLAALKESSAGMMTNKAAMEAYNLAAMLVGDQFANELPNAMGYLTKVSAATGESMDFMMTSLVRGVGRLSPMILDNLGIQVDLTKAYEDYSEEMGVAVDEMSKAEQQTALMNQAMGLLQKNTAAMPEVTGTAAAAMGSLKAQLQDTKDTIGLALLPTFTKIMGKVSAFAKENLPKLVTAFEQHVVPALETATQWLGENIPRAIDTVRGAIDWVTTAIGEFQRGFGWAVSEGMDPFTAAMTGVAEVLDDFLGEEVMDRVWDFVDGMQKAITFIEENATPIIAGLGTVAVIAFGAWAVSAGAAAVATLIALAPVILIVAAIGAAVGLLVAAWEKDWKGIRTILTKFWKETAKPTFEILKVWFTKTLPAALATIRDWFVKAWENITTAVAEAWRKAVQIFEDVKLWFTVTLPNALRDAWDRINWIVQVAIMRVKQIIYETLSSIRAAWETAWGAVQDFLRKAWDTIRIIFMTALILVLDIFGIKLEDLITAWRTTWDAVTAWLSTAWQTIKTTVTTAATAVYDYLKGKLDETLEKWSMIWDMVKAKILAVWDAIKDIVKYAIIRVYFYVKDKIDEIKESWSIVWDAVSTKVSAIWETIKAAVDEAITAVLNSLLEKYLEIKSAILDPLADAWQGVKDTIGDWINLGKDLVRGIAGGIKDKAKDVINAIVSAIKDAIKRAKALIGAFSPSRVFMDIGGSMMEGLALGVARTAAIPIAVTSEVMHRVSAPALFQRPAMTMPVSSSSTVNVNMGGVNIYDQMGAAVFEARVRQIMASAVGA